MHWSFRAIVVTVAIVLATTSITYAGESLLNLPEQTGSCNPSELIPTAKSGVSDILAGLGIQAEAKDSFEKIDPQSAICDNKPLNLNWIHDQLVVAGEATDIAHARDSIIISTGLLHISHSSNNVILCASDVDITHDGNRGGGSLVISKGKIKISFATNSLVYALKGVEISHAHNVQAFNTPERKTSFGHINNTAVTPLFPEEEASNTIQDGSAFAFFVQRFPSEFCLVGHMKQFGFCHRMPPDWYSDEGHGSSTKPILSAQTVWL